MHVISYNVNSLSAVRPNQAHQYSLWNQHFPFVRLQNKGWRINYVRITENPKDRLKDAKILPDIKHSDHCPVYTEFKS